MALRRDMKITDLRRTATDGQHRHGHQHANIEVDETAMRLVARHIQESDCVAKPINPEAQIPLQFTMNSDLTGDATVMCGICKQVLGSCKVKNIKEGK